MARCRSRLSLRNVFSVGSFFGLPDHRAGSCKWRRLQGAHKRSRRHIDSYDWIADSYPSHGLWGENQLNRNDLTWEEVADRLAYRPCCCRDSSDDGNKPATLDAVTQAPFFPWRTRSLGDDAPLCGDVGQLLYVERTFFANPGPVIPISSHVARFRSQYELRLRRKNHPLPNWQTTIPRDYYLTTTPRVGVISLCSSASGVSNREDVKCFICFQFT